MPLSEIFRIIVVALSRQSPCTAVMSNRQCTYASVLLSH